MKVFGQVQFIAAFFVLSVFVNFGCYATLQEKAEQTQKEQYQAEVNGKQNSSWSRVRFGTKTGAKTRLDGEHILAHGNRSSNESISTAGRKVMTRTSRNRNTKSAPTSTELPQSPSLRSSAIKQHVNKTLVSRSYDSHRQQRPTAQALVTQHDIPIVYKTQATYHPNSSSSDSNVNSRKRGQHKSRQQSASRADQVPKVSQIQSLESGASNSLIKDANMSSNKVNRTIQANAVTNELVSTPTRGRQSRNTTALSVSTSRPFFSNGFQLSNPFDFIPQIFGNLSRPVSPTALYRKPPKKYKSSTSTTSTTPVISVQFEKQSYRKAQLETSPIQTTKQPMELVKQNNDGPFRIALPTVNFFNPPTTSELNSNFEKEKGKRATVQTLRERYNCPRESEVRFQLFPKICQTDKDCSIWNRDELCCEIFGASSCVSGIPKPLEETSHMPILGVIPRKCPTRPLAELWWDVQECETDNDCWPRVCCPDGRRRYCRTSQPELETVPVPVKRSFNYLTEYLECTSPPPPIFDLHPKACTSTFDCFPNVCCQEAGLRHCRPPKKSVLTLMANFLNVDFVKRLTQNIVIK